MIDSTESKVEFIKRINDILLNKVMRVFSLELDYLIKHDEELKDNFDPTTLLNISVAIVGEFTHFIYKNALKNTEVYLTDEAKESLKERFIEISKFAIECCFEHEEETVH